MSQRYLIRRKLTKIIGPLNLDQLKKSFKGMEFGTSDEVCADCGPWVEIDNKEDLKAYYPDLYKIFYKSSSQPLSSYESTKKKKKKKTKERHFSYNFAMIFLLFALSGMILTYIVINEPKYLAMVEKVITLPVSQEKIAKYFQEGDLQNFNSYMNSHLGEILDDISVSEDKDLNTWMPYLRFYVFQIDGESPGVSFKNLRGSHAISAPLNCSYRAWLKRWMDSAEKWQSFAEGKSFPNGEWAKLLSWNSSLLNTRHHPGWSEPKNYYGACVFMAFKSFDSLISDVAFVDQMKAKFDRFGPVVDTIYLRLSLMSAQVNKTIKPEHVYNNSKKISFLSSLNCMDEARSQSELEACDLTGNKKMLLSYKKRYRTLKSLHLALKQRNISQFEKALDEETLESMKSLTDELNKLDFAAEVKVIELIKEGISLKEIEQQIRLLFPHVKLFDK